MAAMTARLAGVGAVAVALVCWELAAGPAAQSPFGPDASDRHRLVSPSLTLSVVATTDLHGVIFPSGSQGGLAGFGGYLKALRSQRESDGGAVLLVDAGDMFLGGIESDLSEGALVIDAYNALGYTAAAIGNHEFDFGAVDLAGAREGRGDRQGAIKARARQARFPLLAANLIDDLTGRTVSWPNVRPSVLVEAAGIKVGIIGVMTLGALRATLPSNAGGLHVTPLAPAIEVEASTLRRAGAAVVLVVSHAGGRCTRFNDPRDLSSCDPDAEIFQVARALPNGLVDVIAAGHSHEAMAHLVNGIAIVQAYPRGQGFARVDVAVERHAKRTTGVTLFPSRAICIPGGDNAAGCDEASGPATPGRAEYEGRPVAPDRAITAAMAPALARVRELQAASLGVTLDAPLVRGTGAAESPLGNMFADALLDSSAGADAAVTNNRIGGLRADLPAGPVTFGRLYDVFPFDNRVVRLSLTGADLMRVLADEVSRRRPGALAIAGLQVRAACAGGHVAVTLSRRSGRQVGARERLVVATMDYLAAGAVFSSVIPPGPLAVGDNAPLLREVVERWLRRHGKRPGTEPLVERQQARWEYPEDRLAGCGSM